MEYYKAAEKEDNKANRREENENSASFSNFLKNQFHNMLTK